MQLAHESPSAGLCALLLLATPASAPLKSPVTWFVTTKMAPYCALRMRMQLARWNMARERSLASCPHQQTRQLGGHSIDPCRRHPISYLYGSGRLEAEDGCDRVDDDELGALLLQQLGQAHLLLASDVHYSIETLENVAI